MAKNPLTRFIGMFFQKKRKWISLNVEKLYFEAPTDRYFLILRAAGKLKERAVFFNIGNLFEENIINKLYLNKDSLLKLFESIGIKIQKLRIIKKVNSSDSAECIIRFGFYRKSIRMSTIDAVRLASENNMSIDIPEELLKTEKFDLSENNSINNMVQNNIFTPKFIERDFFNNEVIM